MKKAQVARRQQTNAAHDKWAGPLLEPRSRQPVEPSLDTTESARSRRSCRAKTSIIRSNDPPVDPTSGASSGEHTGVKTRGPPTHTARCALKGRPKGRGCRGSARSRPIPRHLVPSRQRVTSRGSARAAWRRWPRTDPTRPRGAAGALVVGHRRRGSLGMAEVAAAHERLTRRPGQAGGLLVEETTTPLPGRGSSRSAGGRGGRAASR